MDQPALSSRKLQSFNEELQTVSAEVGRKVTELDRANSDLQNLLDSTQIATIFLDAELHIKNFTPAAGNVFRLIPGDIGRPITDLAAQFPEVGLVDDIRAVLSSLVARERQLAAAEGRYFQMRVMPYRTVQNAIDGVVLTFTDVTQLEQAQQALRNLNEDLKHFAYAASHDLQEPLRMVTAYTQLLARQYKGKLDSQADQFINYAVAGAERMETLLKGLRDYWSVNEQRLDHDVLVDCNRVLETALVDLASRIEESGAIVTHDFLPTVIGEEAALGMLFQNLVGNSIKYRREGEPPRIHVSAQRGDDVWRFSVRDNGMGIEPEFLEAIFAPFKRLHGAEYDGTGIGLTISQRIVDRYGGRIWVESTFGSGSAFCFTLPAAGG
jgi:signal transduction histidine kinase